MILHHPTPPDPAAVLALLASGKSTADAARTFGVHERSIRRIRQRHQTRQHAPERATARVARPVLQTAIPPHDSDESAHAAPQDEQRFATVAPSAVAREGQMFKCVFCGDLHFPLPGTTGEEWARTGCYLCQTKRAAPTIVLSHEPDRTPDTTPDTDTDRTPDTPEIEADRTPDRCPVSDPPAPAADRTVLSAVPRVVVQERTRIVRVPVKPPRTGALAWARNEVFAPGPVLALIIVGLLIAICAA